MKITTISRIVVASVGALGCILLVSSQPNTQLPPNTWPRHSILPAQVSLSQVQEFKDAASIHLNDIQRNLGASNEQAKWYAIAVKSYYKDAFVEKAIVWNADAVSAGTVGTPLSAKKLSPAALAALYYTFDHGIDLIARNPKSTATATITPTLITANIKSSDMGMTAGQFHQAVMQYVDSHPMRYWNEARVGLASGR